jgi:hypothetical protein
MGTTQSKQDESQFEKVLDALCACPCQPMQDPKARKSRTRNLSFLFPYSSHFNLNLLHPSSGPYLGTSVWEAIEERGEEGNGNATDTDSDDEQMLNVSHYPAADEEFLPLPSPMTPPRCANLNISHEYVSSPSFFLQHNSSFSSPRRIRRSRTHESTHDNSDSAYSARTGTTTSTEECYDEKGVEATILNDGIDIKITRTFAPRKLFDSQDQDNDTDANDRVGPLHHGSQATNNCRRSRKAAGSPPPPAPDHIMNSPSKSIDQSIIMRKGILIQQTRAQIPSPTSTVTCHNLSPSRVSNRYIPDGLERNNMLHINTLPSFKDAHPIRLKIKESYQGYETKNLEQEGGKMEDMNASNLSLLSDAEQACFFSYDPYFSLGTYLISTLDGGQYGNGLNVKMGERYMTLQDRNKRVWGVMRSRHTWIPSSVIYSPTPRYPSQTPSSHRPCGEMDGHLNADGVELYPWAIVKKHGRRMDHDVSIHMVAKKKLVSTRNTNKDMHVDMNNAGGDLVGGLFDKKPAFRSRHGFDELDNHQHTVVYRVNAEDEEVPCCIMVRDPIKRDLFDITIAPGIDPLMIICYMAVHSKMVSSYNKALTFI